MSAVVTVPQLIDCVDSYYQYVKGRVVAVNPQREFGGIVQARDWPLKKPKMEAPYLLLQSDDVVAFGKVVSQADPSVNFRVQWVWLVQGDNIQADQQAANRGDKYRLNMQIIQEMIVGSYPGFCEKKQYTVVDDGNGIAVQSVASYNPPEQIRWSTTRFIDKIDTNTGILFCSGVVTISGFAPEITQ